MFTNELQSLLQHHFEKRIWNIFLIHILKLFNKGFFVLVPKQHKFSIYFSNTRYLVLILFLQCNPLLILLVAVIYLLEEGNIKILVQLSLSYSIVWLRTSYFLDHSIIIRLLFIYFPHSDDDIKKIWNNFKNSNGPFFYWDKIWNESLRQFIYLNKTQRQVLIKCEHTIIIPLVYPSIQLPLVGYGIKIWLDKEGPWLFNVF